MRPADVLKLVCSVNFNKTICLVNSDKPERPDKTSTLARLVISSNFVLSVNIRTVDTNKPLCLVNSSKFVSSVDVHKPIPSVNSNKTVRTVNSNKPVNSKIERPVDTRKPVCPVNSSTINCTSC